MNLHFPVKEPDKAYLSNSLWLPKSGIREGPVQRALEFTVYSEAEQANILLRLWDESSTHVICPREFLPAKQYSNYAFPFVDLRPAFQKVDFEDLVIPRDEEQERAWEALKLHDNGILNLACGKGKTKLSLKKIAQRGVPTLVIVPDTGILTQWIESIYGDEEKGLKPGLRFEGELGMVQGAVCKWAHPVTLALVTTLYRRIEEGALPEEFFRYFGLVIYDEVHRIGAPKFSLTAKPFYGDRIGLTATAEREDGLDPIYRYHIGDIFYSDLSQRVIPDIYFQQVPSHIKFEDARTKAGTINISILRSLLARDSVANIFRYWHIKTALDAGRKILALSHSKVQLKLLHALFPGSGLIVSETKDRMNVLRDNQLVFAIAKLGNEGIDDDRLDTLFQLTPYKSKNALQQSFGRIQRPLPGKKKPLVVIFEDWLAPPLKKLCQSLKHELKLWKYPFNTVKPNDVPQQLPPELSEIYRTAMQALAKEEEEDE